MTKTPARTARDLVTAEPGTRATGDGYEDLGVVVKYSGRVAVHLDPKGALRLARQLTDAVNSIIATSSPKRPITARKAQAMSNRTTNGTFAPKNSPHAAACTTQGVGESKSSAPAKRKLVGVNGRQISQNANPPLHPYLED